MEEFKTWYELLGHLVETPQAKQRLANQLNVTLVTVTRWTTHASTPRPAMLRAILSAFPEYRKEFLLLFARDNIHLQGDEKDTPSQEDDIPSAQFYMHILSVYRQIAPTVRSATLQQLILADALEHLDPQQQGCACALLLCLPPRGDNPVRSLYIAEGRGNNPWPPDLRQEGNLLGAESLAGSVTTAGRPLLVDREEVSASMVPSRWGQHERSALAAPIMRGLQIAGCFLVSSTQPGTRLAGQQQRIICYADLLLLAIEADQWYDHQSIRLRLMPGKENQKPSFTHLSQQVVARMVHERNCTYPVMKLRIMQEIEESFIQSVGAPWPDTTTAQTRSRT